MKYKWGIIALKIMILIIIIIYGNSFSRVILYSTNNHDNYH